MQGLGRPGVGPAFPSVLLSGFLWGSGGLVCVSLSHFLPHTQASPALPERSNRGPERPPGSLSSPQVSSLASSHTQGSARWGMGSEPLRAQRENLERPALALSHLIPFISRIFCVYVL